ncbi:MAG: hypothetical protein R3248_09490 [Candidatus Promineifilaceae bacterium]|nr:hypothetical protein [Candidatus Promineifilaceae bacterium]
MNRQLERIESVYVTLEERAQHAAPEAPAHVESEAYQLHNLYSAIEDLLQMVAAAFENSVTDLSRWHSQLIDRMTLDVEGMRPALLGEDTARLLHELRAFRHFFRHAYVTPLEYERVQSVLEYAYEVRPLLKRDVKSFLETLEAGE